MPGEQPNFALTLADIAGLMEEKVFELNAGERRRFAAYVGSDPRLERPLTWLRQLANDAGLDPAREPYLLTACEIYQDSQKLLDAEEDGWTQPSEILDPDGDRGIAYEELLNLLRARQAREAPSDPHFATVVERVRRASDRQAVADDALVARCTDRFSELAPRDVVRLLSRITREARRDPEIRELEP